VARAAPRALDGHPRPDRRWRGTIVDSDGPRLDAKIFPDRRRSGEALGWKGLPRRGAMWSASGRDDLVQHDSDGIRLRECRRTGVLSLRSAVPQRRGSGRLAAFGAEGAARHSDERSRPHPSNTAITKSDAARSSMPKRTSSAWRGSSRSAPMRRTFRVTEVYGSRQNA
jgi:hypothetical protein